LPLQWRQRPEISRRETASPSRLHQRLLNHQRVHVHETHLKQVQRQHQHLLVIPPVAGELSTLYIGLGLVFVLYGLTIRSIFSFLRHTRREPVYVWIAFLLSSAFICSGLACFALLPHTPEPSIKYGRPLVDYLYYEIMTFTTVGYGDIVPTTAQGKLLAMCTALLGATHGVTFVAIVLLALTQQPPAKNQE
jgi:hypothetical protein